MDYLFEISNYWNLKKKCGLYLIEPPDNETRNQLKLIEEHLKTLPEETLHNIINKMVLFLSDLELASDFSMKTGGLSKNQGLMYKNYLFVKIRSEIIWAAEMAGIGIPVVTLYYTSDPADKYNDQELNRIIKEAKEKLTHEIKSLTFNDFVNIIEGLGKKVLDLGGFDFTK